MLEWLRSRHANRKAHPTLTYEIKPTLRQTIMKMSLPVLSFSSQFAVCEQSEFALKTSNRCDGQISVVGLNQTCGCSTRPGRHFVSLMSNVGQRS